MMKKFPRFSFLLLVTAFLCFFVLPAVAAERIVDNSGDLNPGSIVEPVYPTIQAAVDAALSGDTITVKTGTYREHVEISGKSLTFEVDGDVNLTVPEPELKLDAESFSASDWAVWSEDLPEMTSPVISIDQGAAQSVEVSFEGFNFVAPEPFTCDPCYAVSAALFAGDGTSLSVTDCEFNGAFMVPVMVTTYEEVFNDMVFDEFDFYLQGTMPTANLEMSGCSFQNYLLAGTSLVGPEVSGTITNNSFSGMSMESPASNELDPALVVDGFRSSVLSGTLFSQGIDRNYVGDIPMGAAGVLLLNSGQNEEVTLSGNTITGNLLGIGVLKDFRIVKEFTPSAEEGTDTTISGNESISGNLVGVAVIGGFAEQLVWSPDYGISLDEYVESWDLSVSSTTTLEISGEEHIEGNVVGALLVGGVSADVNSCYFKDNLLAGMVALGDLEGSVISNNEFSGTVGVNLLYGLGSSFWNMQERPFSPGKDIEPTVAVEITGNTFAGNGLVEGAHEFISYLLGGEEGDVLSLTSSMATRMGSYGPMAILPSGFSPSQSIEGTPTLAGVILLDGVSYVNFHDNEVTGSILGITAMDVGFSSIINDMEEESILYIPGLYRVMIQNNDIVGNLSGLNLLGARELVWAALYDAPENQFDPSTEPFIENNIGLDDFVVRGNNITENHFGVVNALDVQDLGFTGNRVNNNYVMGMINAGMDAWAFREVFSDDLYLYREVVPSARIFGNSFNYNGIVDSELDDLPIGTETLGAYIKGGILVFDVPASDFSDNIQAGPGSELSRIRINRNAIKGNGNYGLAVVGRVDELHDASVEPISTDLWFDATENFWGDPSGPSSYFGEDSEVVFFDPDTLVSGDNAGDAITGIVFEEDGQYYPYDFQAKALYVRPLNCIHFDPWLGENGEDVTGVTGGEVVNGEEGTVEQDMGDGNTVIATLNGEGDWTLVRYGQNPGEIPDLQVNSGGYYSLDVEGSVSEITLRFNVSSSSAPDIYWYDPVQEEWVKLTPSASGSGFVEFTFNSESDPTIGELLGSYAPDSLVPGYSEPDTVYFAQSGTTSGGGSSGGGGCNIAWAGVPSIALLLPLMMLFLKK